VGLISPRNENSRNGTAFAMTIRGHKFGDRGHKTMFL